MPVADLSVEKLMVSQSLSPLNTWLFNAAALVLQSILLHKGQASGCFHLLVSVVHSVYLYKVRCAPKKEEVFWICGLFMSVPLAHSSPLVPVQEIYSVCSSLNTHCTI